MVMFRKCLQLLSSVVWKETYFWLAYKYNHGDDLTKDPLSASLHLALDAPLWQSVTMQRLPR